MPPVNPQHFGSGVSMNHSAAAETLDITAAQVKVRGLNCTTTAAEVDTSQADKAGEANEGVY